MALERLSSKARCLGGPAALVALAGLAVPLVLFPSASQAQSATQETFSSASEAGQALITALRHSDQQTLLKVLGPNGKDIISSGDEVEDKDDAAQFVQKYQEMHRLVMEPDGTTTLYIGAENWPTPIPLMHVASKWYFDTAAGKQEVLVSKGREKRTGRYSIM